MGKLSPQKVIAALLFTIGALFHGIAMTWPSISIPETAEVHLLFVLVNIFMALTVLKMTAESRDLTISMLAVLSTHQVIVHGVLIIEAASKRTVDFQSIGTLVSLIAVWACVATDPR